MRLSFSRNKPLKINSSINPFAITKISIQTQLLPRKERSTGCPGFVNARKPKRIKKERPVTIPATSLPEVMKMLLSGCFAIRTEAMMTVLIINESLSFERAIPFELLISRFRSSEVNGVTIRNARFSTKNENPSSEAM